MRCASVCGKRAEPPDPHGTPPVNRRTDLKRSSIDGGSRGSSCLAALARGRRLVAAGPLGALWVRRCLVGPLPQPPAPGGGGFRSRADGSLPVPLPPHFRLWTFNFQLGAQRL